MDYAGLQIGKPRQWNNTDKTNPVLKTSFSIAPALFFNAAIHQTKGFVPFIKYAKNVNLRLISYRKE